MKVPFDFSITLVFRLVFPGLVVATAVMPFCMALLKWLGLAPIAPSVVLPALAVLFGWLIVLCDQPIYMFMEGRRYWPVWWRGFWVRRQASRLKRIQDRYAKFKDSDKVRADEINLHKLEYPFDAEQEIYEALYPTRLGNLLTAYERYPNAAYKLDPIFYWYRLWVVLDKDLRGTLDDAQAIADSGLYVSFALFLSAAILVGYAVGGLVWPYWPWTHFTMTYLPAPRDTLGFALISAILGYVIYRISLFQQTSYGELFKALFDQNRDKLDKFVDSVALEIGKQGGDPEEILEAKFRVVSRYLRWHRIRQAPPPATPP